MTSRPYSKKHSLHLPYSQRPMICPTQNTALPQARASNPTHFQGAQALGTPKTRPLSSPTTLLCSTQALHPPKPPPSPISLPQRISCASAFPSTSHSCPYLPQEFPQQLQQPIVAGSPRAPLHRKPAGKGSSLTRWQPETQ